VRKIDAFEVGQPAGGRLSIRLKTDRTKKAPRPAKQ
jgi:hypothetical protein